MLRNVVGPRIREARKSQRPQVTQGELAARLQVIGFGINQATVSKIERQLRPVTDIEVIALAGALDVPVAWILGEEGKAELTEAD